MHTCTCTSTELQGEKHRAVLGGIQTSSFFLGKVTALGVLCCFALFVCLILLASFFLPSHLSFKNMYILGLVFGVIGGFITPAFSFILS